MLLITRRSRIVALVGMWLLTSTTYLLIAALAATLHPAISPAIHTTLDQLIPLFPISLLVYLTLGPFTLLAAWYGDDAAFRRLLVAALVAMLVAYILFLVFPQRIERGALPVDQPWQALFLLLRQVDGPLNSCPSLHVVYTAQVLAMRPWPWPVWLWGTAIIISTLTTRQHLVVDVATGVGLAATTWWLAGRWSHR